MERRLVLWFPDWPVTAYLRGAGPRVAGDAPIAVLAQNAVVACSPAARREGVRRGMRRRDAQSRSPALRIVADDAARDAREFLPVADRIERFAPGLQVIRPGLCSLRIR
ncbi:MAG: DNA polymerase Y family protein, partial [Microbacteriaceae bacterium]|nr:DNA polymerase Y family protein [Microbacteriaceae bacterium]